MAPWRGTWRWRMAVIRRSVENHLWSQEAHTASGRPQASYAPAITTGRRATSIAWLIISIHCVRTLAVHVSTHVSAAR